MATRPGNPGNVVEFYFVLEMFWKFSVLQTSWKCSETVIFCVVVTFKNGWCSFKSFFSVNEFARSVMFLSNRRIGENDFALEIFWNYVRKNERPP